MISRAESAPRRAGAHIGTWVTYEQPRRLVSDRRLDDLLVLARFEGLLAHVLPVLAQTSGVRAERGQRA